VGRIPADWWRSFFTGVALDGWRGVTTDGSPGLLLVAKQREEETS
jgi:hypothetical protein